MFLFSPFVFNVGVFVTHLDAAVAVNPSSPLQTRSASSVSNSIQINLNQMFSTIFIVSNKNEHFNQTHPPLKLQLHHYSVSTS